MSLSFRKSIQSLLVIACLSVALNATAAENEPRTFMFVGEPNAAAWKFMMDNPEDRKTQVEGAFKKLGGEVLSYYWGLGNGKNYIIVTIPNDNELIQAIYLMRLPAGLLNSYVIIELMPSSDMSAALIRSKALLKDDKTIK